MLICSYSIDTAAKHNTTVPCLPDQASSLLQLKRSFIDIDANLASWRGGKDCCHWEGVTCDMASGRVITLDLAGFNLKSRTRRLHPALFNLTSLRNLSLASNNFRYAHLPTYGFEQLTDIIHLNFSRTYFSGQIPIEITRLKNLVTLDFSGSFFLYFQEPNFQTFMANLSNLRELYLDFVDISSSGSTWSVVLADSVPQLQILSLSDCYLSGPIDPSFSRLRSLTAIDLGYNELTGKFPTKIFQIKSLRTLDLSRNPNLSVCLPDFPLGNNLEILNLAGSTLSCDIPPSLTNLKSLKTLGLSTIGISKGPSLISKLPSLNELQLYGWVGNSLEKTELSWVGNLKQLTSLELSGYDFSQSVPYWIGNSTSLTSLTIFECNFARPMPYQIGNLTSLTSLSITDCNFAGPMPYQIGNLVNLTSLEFWNCNLSGPMPYQIGNLKQLTSLVLFGYDFSQSVPYWIGNLTSLTSLSITDCNFAGPILSTIGTLAQLESIDLRFNNLTGKIPQSLFALPTLQELDLSSNQLSGPLEDIPAPSYLPLYSIDLSGNQLTGPIPKSLFALPALQELDLSLNQLSGPLGDIPTPSYSPLYLIDLSMNQLTGPIPESFFQLKHLEWLGLASNRLSGIVELSSLWRLKSLSYLDLSNNMLSIVDEDGDNVLPSPPNIKHLYLASCNLTKLPGALRYLDKVSGIDLSSNQINGVIPSWIWENWKDQLQSLNLSNNMFTTLEKSPSLVHMPNLYALDLSFNRLQGTIPIPVTSIPGSVLDYSNNNFSSIVPNFGRYIRSFYLNLSKNKLNGHVPSSICSARELNIMDFSYNNFSGSVPSCLIESGNLSILKLRANQIQGMLPENIREGCTFQTIDLNGNQIEGKLPRSLSNCQDLELLDVGNNQIVDSFPSWLGVLPRLRVLVLRTNQLNGTIRDIKDDHSISNHFASLQILDLASNSFSGNLPKGWFNELKAMMANVNDEGQVLGYQTNSTGRFYQDTVTVTFKGFDLSFTKILTTFKAIDISNNSFDGPLPELIGRLVSLHGLNMSYNNFTGQIPSQFSKLSQLESLDLSWNQLAGEIPQELTSLTYLAFLNLSHNNLIGRIPQGNQFLSFPNSSFEGNVGLCGIPLSRQCDTSGSITPGAVAPQEPNSLWQDRFGAILLFAFVGLGFGVGFALSFMVRLFCRIEGWVCKH